MLRRVIQYYNADFTIGLTATDQRPDKRKLETVFGTYSTSLSLKEAMEKGVIFCVNVSHANEMTKLLNKANITAANYTGQTKNPTAVMAEFKQNRMAKKMIHMGCVDR